MAEETERPDDAERPEDQAPEQTDVPAGPAPQEQGPESGPPKDPIAPDEAGRSEPVEPAGQADAPDDQPDEAAPTEPAGRGEETESPAPDAQADELPPSEAVGLDAGADAPPEEPTPAPAEAATDEMVEAADEADAAADAVDDFIEEEPRRRPEIPGAHLEVDIVPEGSDPLGREAIEGGIEEIDVPADEPVQTEAEVAIEPEADAPAQAVIDLGADARYRATGKRKTAVARVILRPGTGRYHVNARPLEDHFPRPALQRNIRQPLETVGYDSRMDVVASLHGGGVSSQAGALRHGISRALIEADPNLRGELKRRGFLTRDPRVKERKKAGLKKARKRPQFSKR